MTREDREKAIEILRADDISSYSVDEILSARDLAVEALKQMATTKNDLGVDAISRQAAIDAIRRIRPIDTEYDCTLFDKVDVMYVLNELPSVTPQEPYPCDTCKHNKDPWYTEPCDSCCGSDGYEQKYIEREVLDKIKAKIEQSRYGLDDGLDLALNIIDECVAETEET